MKIASSQREVRVIEASSYRESTVRHKCLNHNPFVADLPAIQDTLSKYGNSVANPHPHLQISGGPGQPDPEIRGEGAVSKKSFKFREFVEPYLRQFSKVTFKICIFANLRRYCQLFGWIWSQSRVGKTVERRTIDVRS